MCYTNSLSRFFLFSTLITLFSIASSPSLSAQDILYIQNPSFEDTAHYSRVPEGWLNGGFPGETPPDIAPSGHFRETTEANHGDTYLAMVTRDGGTWERIGNRLSTPMQAGQCYRWKIDLARSLIYFSVSRVTGKTINFNGPVVLRVFGGYQADTPLELLAVSPPIVHDDWQQYNFCLCPEQDYPVLILEAMYRRDATKYYAGNLLLDNTSHLQLQADCSSDFSKEREQWAAPFPDFSKPVAFTPAAVPLDTQSIGVYLKEIIDGHVDIGLSELAMLVQKSANGQLLLTINESAITTPTLSVKSLRKRLQSMGLNSSLKIKKYRLETTYGKLIVRSPNGVIMAWSRTK